MSAALRVFLFSAAFPFFSNVDEREHFDLVVKYSCGQVPHHLLPYSEESAVYFVQYGSPEFFYTPQHYPEREFPAPFWTFPVEETVGPLQTRTAAWVSRINHEASEPPLYYAMAGIWMRVGDWLGLNGGFLLYWIRFLNMFLAAALVCLGAWVVRSLFPERGFVQLGVILLLAFYPQDTFYSIESDVLSPLLFGLVFLAMVKWMFTDAPSIRLAVFTGLALAGTGLVKATNWPLLGVAALAALFHSVQLF